MKKFAKFFIATAFVAAMSMIAGAKAWGDTKTEGFETASTSTTYNSTATITTAKSDCGIAWSIYYGNVSATSAINGNNSCLIRYYTADEKLGYAKTTTGIQGLSNVSFKAKVTNTGNKMGVWYSTDGTNWTALASNVTLSTTEATKSYDIPNSSSSTTYYIKIGLTTGSSTNKKDLIIDDVVFTYSLTPTCAAPTFSPAAGTYTSAQNVTISTTTENATIYYTTDGSVPSTGSTVYTSVIPVSATTTIKAIAAKADYNNSSVSTATYAILGHSGTNQDPYTVADARAAIDADAGLTNKYVSGIVCTVGSNLTSGALTYWISDDGTETDKLQVYRGKGINQANFTSTDDIQIGDVVVVYGTLKMYNSTYEFDSGNYLVSLSRTPVISAAPTPLAVPNYEEGTAEPEYETLTVNGSYLTSDITISLDNNSNFELSSDLSSWSNSLSLTQTAGSVSNEEVAVRLKAGLSKGDYNGAITLSSTDATDVVVNLSGSVTGKTYSVIIDNQVTGGTISADVAKAAEGATINLTSTPDAAYSFGSWTILEDDMSTEVAVNNNQFTMPACDVYVTATFNLKPTYPVTCAFDNTKGELDASPASAYEGQTVTLSYIAKVGYALSSIAITKTSDSSATGITPVKSGEDYTFTMPAYAVTATATFEETIDYATLPFEFDGGKSDISGVVGLTESGIGSDYGSSPKLKFDNENDYLILKFNERPGKLSYKIKGNAFSGGTFKVQASVNGLNYTDLKTYDDLGDVQTESINDIDENVRYIRWIYSNKSNGNVALGNIKLSKGIANITPNVYSISASEGETSGTLEVEYRYIETSAGIEVKWYEQDGKTPASAPDWMVATVNNVFDVDYLIEQNPGLERKAYFKLYGIDKDTNDVYSDLITVTQAAYTVAALPFAFDDGKSAIKDKDGLNHSGLGDDYGSSPKLRFDSTDDYLVLHYTGAASTLSFDIKGNSFSGTFKVQVSSTGKIFEDIKTYTNLGATKSEVINLSTSIRYIKWVYSNKVNGNVALGNISVTAFDSSASTITLGATLNNGRYWATFYNAARFVLPVGAQAYTMNSSKQLYLLGEDGSVIPANTAVVVIADSPSIILTKSDDDTAIDVNGASNVLVGSETDVLVSGVDGTPYVLGVKNGSLGFYQYIGTSIPAYKAYYIVK